MIKKDKDKDAMEGGSSIIQPSNVVAPSGQVDPILCIISNQAKLVRAIGLHNQQLTHLEGILNNQHTAIVGCTKELDKLTKDLAEMRIEVGRLKKRVGK